MTIEQKPELNRFVDVSIPITWAWRWRQFKITLPIWCFIWACFFEMGIIAAWMNDKLTWGLISKLFGGLLAFTGIMWALIEIFVRLRQRSKRILKVEDKRIVVSPAKNGFVPWKKVCRFQFEPIPELPDSRRLTIFLRGFKKQSQSERPFWMMVLEQPPQAMELASCLEAKRTENGSDFEMVLLKEPAKLIQGKSFPFAGMSFTMTGMYFLLHGIPLLGVVLEKNHGLSDGDRKLGAHAAAAIRHFVQQHFSNIQELHNFTLLLGASLIIVGFLFYFLGLKLMNRKPEKLPTQI
jgi:hypothetical protein